jgi:phospholipid transport system substrate-binding protein
MRSLTPAVSLGFLLGLLAVAAPAHAGTPLTFIQGQHAQLTAMLHQPASPTREVQVDRSLDAFLDYGEITRRTFGAPCHPSIATCEDLWAQLDSAQQAEVTSLMRQLVRKSYRKNLIKTLNFAVTYKGMKPQGADTRVLTEAQDTTKPRDPPTRVEYLVRATASGFVTVDLVTEESSMTKNYYTQFRDKMHDPAQGYSRIVAKLRERIASP